MEISVRSYGRLDWGMEDGGYFENVFVVFFLVL